MTSIKHFFYLLILSVMVTIAPLGMANAGQVMVLQSTTSTHNSGLYDAILPQFTKDTGIVVRVVAVGTGQAIRNASNCDGDVLLVHSKKAEDEFVAQGFGIARYDLMVNDFVIIGPKSDPAGLQNASSVVDALQKISSAKAMFISRGDDSGTHKAEQRLWQAAGLAPKSFALSWYKEVGNGMGATINIAVETNAYTLSDRATWTAFNNKFDAKIVFENDSKLNNQYGIIAINPEHCPYAQADAAGEFVSWMLSAKGQAAIAGYKRGGVQLFFPNAK